VGNGVRELEESPHHVDSPLSALVGEGDLFCIHGTVAIVDIDINFGSQQCPVVARDIDARDASP